MRTTIFVSLLIGYFMLDTQPVSSATLDNLGDSNAYAYYRHRHSTRVRHRHHRHVIYRPSPATPKVAPSNLGPFNPQEAVRFQLLDVSDYLKPIELLIDFPKDPGPRRLYPDEVVLLNLERRIAEGPNNEGGSLPYWLMFIGSVSVSYGTLGMLLSCHKRSHYRWVSPRKSPQWLVWLVGRCQRPLVSLT